MPLRVPARLFRIGFNLFPAYRRTGGRITHLAEDYSEAEVTLKLRWTTRNYFGTLFGGSLYGAIDPVYAILLMRRLGPGYAAWDKAAVVRFRRPGRGTVTATFRVPDEEVAAVRAALEAAPSLERTYHVELVDASGAVVCEAEKTVHVRREA